VRFESNPSIELQSLTAEILSIEATLRAGRGVQRDRLISLLERKTELERELNLDSEATYGC
jgi:hypothetical protein